MHTKHRPSEKQWDKRYGHLNAAAMATGVNFHGYCQMTGTHIINAVCSCGAKRYVCVGSGKVRWIEPDPRDREDEE